MTVAGSVPNADAPATLPLLSGQYGMWLHEQMDPDNPALSTAGFIDITGPVDVEMLQRATELALHDCECLRVQIQVNDGIPEQVIDPTPIQVPIVDFSSFPDPEATAESWASEQMADALPLSRGGMRSSVVKLGAQRAAVYLEGHHVKWDGISGALVGGRIAQRYQWLVDGTEPEVWPAYAELVAEDLAYLSSDRHDVDAEYWRSTIDSTLPITAMYQGGWQPPKGELRRSTVFSAQWHEQLRELARGSRTTWAVLGFALTAAYLARRTGNREVTLTIPVARRSTETAKLLPGMLANFLPLRVEVRPDEDVTELASRISADVKGLTKAQRYPAGAVRRLLGLDSGDLRPLGPSVNILGYPGAAPMGEAFASTRDLSTGPVEDLQFEFQVAVNGEVRLHLNVNPQLHSAETAEQMLEEFVGFVGTALAEPRPSVGSIDLSGREPAAKAGRSAEIRGLDRPVPALDLLSRLRQADPERMCLVEPDGRRFSNREFLALVAASYTELRGNGFGEASVLAVEAVPSARLVAAILAAWQLGGAYFPVAADTPANRLAHLFGSTGAGYALAGSAEFAANAAEAAPGLCFLRNDLAAADSAASTELVQLPVSEHAPAYIIFTSGSTGLPKGAVLSRRGMMNHLLAKVEDLELAESDLVAMTAPLTFDISVWQMFAPLLAGSGLRLVDRQTSVDRDALLELVAGEQISVLEIVPSLLRTVVEGYLAGDDLARPESLRLLLVTGEELPLDVARAWHAQFPGIPVVNAYGPTECSDDVTHAWLTSAGSVAPGSQEATPAPPTVAERAPIGRALRNTSLYILDEFLRPVAPGRTGELYVGGVGVGIGYAADPARSASAFIPNPWAAPGARMYRTGDLVRLRADRQLEFLGRQDHQVKIRGFRIELGEVEAAVRAVPGVADAVVATHGQGLRRGLVAYVLATDPEAGASDEWLERGIADLLPAYMRPDIWILLETMPLTANGKVDRKNLPEPQAPDRSTGIDRGESEVRAIGEHFAAILELEQVGQDETFFDLGGNSLLATRLVTALRTRLQLSVSLADIFAHPTPRRLAAATRIASSVQGHTVPIRSLSSAPLSHGQSRLNTLAALNPDDSAYHLGLRVQLDHDVDIEALESGVHDLLQRHPALRTRIGFDGKNTVQVREAVPEHPLRRISVLGRDAAAVIQAEMDRPFDLAAEHPIRFMLLEGEGAPSLVSVAHHIACDGWSFRLLAEDLSAIITGTAMRSSNGPDYLDYAVWQTSAVADGDPWVRADQGFWTEQLAAGFQAPRLAEVTAGPISTTLAGKTTVLELGKTRWEQVSALARECEATPFAVLHTAVALTLAARTGQDRLLLGTAAHARPVPELDQVVGFFTNTVPLPTDLSGPETGPELIRKVWAQDLAVLQHSELPYDRIAALAPASADGGTGALLNCMVALQQDVPEFVPGRPEMTWQLLAPTTARFDLSWEFTTYRDAEGAESLRLRLEHALGLIDPAAAEELVRQWQTVLAELIAAPAAPGRAAADGSLEGPVGQPTIVDSFLAAAQLHPERIAVLSSAETLSYREAAERVLQLARELRRRGVGPEDVVAYVGPRNQDLLVVPLAVLAAGGTYLPVDVENPTERIRGILATAKPAVVVTRTAQRQLIDADAQVLDLDADAAELEQPGTMDPEQLPVPVRHPQQGAYLIFTSGSTGKPTGVRVAQQNLAAFAEQQRRAFGDRDGLRVVQFAAVGFDAYIWELVLTVVCAGTLLVPTRDERLPGEPLATFLATQQAQWFCAPPTVLAAMSPDQVPEDLIVISAGERCPAELTGQWAPGRQMLNAYGPTESTVCVTMTGALIPGAEPSIGAPVSGAELLVLDELLRPVPAGTVGELYVAGDIVAREYFGRPDLTAERFIADLGGNHPGARMYRTGDLVAWTDAGELDYFGRSDDQVKIRGVRVEPGEARAVLLAQPGVAFAEVVPKEDPSGQRQLVGYVVAEAGLAAELLEQLPARLCSAMEAVLPQHFVPRQVLLIEAMPRTLNGKLDVKALPEPAAEMSSAASGGEPGRVARTPAEQTLCGLIAELLDLEDVLPDDDFLRLGGDSILAVTLAGRAKHAGLVLTARQVLELRTAAAMAAVLQGGAPGPDQDSAEAFGSIPLPPVARWMISRTGDLEGFTQSFALRSARLRSLPAVLDLISGLLARHPLLGAVLEGHGATASMRVPRDPLVAAELVSAGEPGEDPGDPESWAAAELSARSGRCLRARWWPDGDDSGDGGGGGILGLEIHHLVVDGVSWRIILDDVDRILAADGAPAAPAGTSYRVWLRRAQALAHDPALLGQAARWSELAGAPSAAAVLQLGSMAEAHQQVVELPAEPTARLLAGAQGPAALSVDSVLFQAYLRAIGTVTGRDRILVRREGHGRDLPELSADLAETVGWFTSEWPVLVDLAAPVGGSTPNGTGFQDGTGFGILRYLAGDPAVAAVPEPDFSFNYLGRAETMRGRYWEGVGRPGRAHFAAGFPQLHLVDLNAIVEPRPEGPVLVARFTASGTAWGAASLTALTGCFLDALIRQTAGAAAPTAPKPVAAEAEADADLAAMAAQLLFELES